MKVKKALPPNYELICKHIPAVRQQPSIIFAYGDTVYSPQVETLRPDLIAHEQVHLDRQDNPDDWWHKYLTDVQFRLDEEVAAYQAQWQWMVENYGRADRRRILKSIVKDLSGAMYGKLVTKDEATKLIRGLHG